MMEYSNKKINEMLDRSFGSVNVLHLENHKHDSLLMDITDALDANIAVLFKVSEECDCDIVKSYGKENDYLDKIHFSVKLIIDELEKDIPLIRRTQSIDKYNNLVEVGVTDFIASLFGDKNRYILFAAKKAEAEGTTEKFVKYDCFFEKNSRDEKFNHIISHLAPIILFIESIVEGDKQLFESVLRNNGFNIARYSVVNDISNLNVDKIEDVKLDVIIDILEGVSAIKEEHKYLKDIYDNSVIPFFIEYVQKEENLPMKEFDNGKNLALSSPFLLSYFLYRLHEDFMVGRKLSDALPPEAQLKFYKSIGWLIKFYFYKKSKSNSENILHFKEGNFDFKKYIMALSYLIGMYSIEILEVDSFFKIEDHLNKFVDAQTLLFSTKSNYRDHFFHMVDICFLGLFLLNAQINGESYVDLLARESKTSVKELKKNWFVGALFHDIGYIFALFNSILKEVEFITSPDIDRIRNNLAASLQKETQVFYESFYNKILKKNGINDQFAHSELDHGVISSAHVINIVKNGKNSAANIKNYLPAITAILRHNLSGIKEQSIKEEPLGTVLTLLDELQEWGRPRYDSHSIKSKMAGSFQFNDSISFETGFLIDCIFLKVENDFNPYTGKGTISYKNNWDFTLDYSHINDQQFNIIFPWFQKSCKFQRLNLMDSVDVNVTFVNSIKGETDEFDILRDKLIEKLIESFDKWIHLVSETHDAKNGKEFITVNIKELFEKKPLDVSDVNGKDNDLKKLTKKN